MGFCFTRLSRSWLLTVSNVQTMTLLHCNDNFKHCRARPIKMPCRPHAISASSTIPCRYRVCLLLYHTDAWLRRRVVDLDTTRKLSAVVTVPVVPTWVKSKLTLTEREALEATRRAISSEKGLAALVMLPLCRQHTSSLAD